MQNVSNEILLKKAIKELNHRKETNPLSFFKPQDYQKPLWDSDKKNIAIIGGNRSGKTMNGGAFVVDYALKNPKSFILCATRASLSVKVQQKAIFDMLPKDSRLTYGVYTQRGFINRTVSLSNGSEIIFRTYESTQAAFQGFKCDLAWLDEELEDWEQNILDEVKLRLLDKNGLLLRTMTPINNGVGSNVYDEFVTNYNPKHKLLLQWNTRSNSYINKEVLDTMLNDMDEKTAKQRIEGSFVNVNEGLVYESFSNSNVVTSSPNGMELIPNIPIDVSCDFNVKLMNWSISQEVNGIIYIFDYVEARDTANTQYMCDQLKEKYPAFSFNFYVDEAGSQKHTNTSKSDHDVIKNNFKTSRILYRHINSIKDRTAATNAMLKNANGKICLYVNEKCKTLIKDFQRVNWDHFTKRGTQGELTHASDGVSYMCYYKHMNAKVKKTVRGSLK